MVSVRHWLLTGRLPASGGGPVQLQNRNQPLGENPLHVARNRLLVGRSRIGLGRAVDRQPAVLIHRNPNRVRLPGLDRIQGSIVRGTIEKSPTLDTGVFGARAIDPLQQNHISVPIHNLIALHVQSVVDAASGLEIVSIGLKFARHVATGRQKECDCEETFALP